MFKGNKKDIRIIKEICSKCSGKSPKLRYWHCYDISVASSGHIQNI